MPIKALYTFVLNTSFRRLLNISPKNVIFIKTFEPESSYIEIWFTDQNYRPLGIEDRINITLVVSWSIKYKNVDEI